MSIQRQITKKQMDFVDGLMRGKSVTQAAVDAGYSKAMGGHALSRLSRNPHVAAELEKRRAALRQSSHYDAKAAVAELDAAIAFAKQTENATAYVRATELKMKLHGLLIERVDQRQVAQFHIHIDGIDDPPAPKTPVLEGEVVPDPFS